MQIHTYALGFELTPSLRGLVESRLFEALRSFDPDVQSAIVRLSAVGRHEAGGTSCEIVVSLRATGELRVRTEDAQMQTSIDRAIRAIRSAVEREVSKPVSASMAAPERAGVNGAFELPLHDNWISQQQREMLERPEHYLRPVRIRPYSAVPRMADNAPSHESAYALVGRGDERVGRGATE